MTIRKTFPLTDPNKAPARVRDKIRQQLNGFSRRQHQKRPPEGYTRWIFDCKIGPSAAAAAPRPFNELGTVVEQMAAAGATEVYVEITARPGLTPLR